jgi:hypothetical protein
VEGDQTGDENAHPVTLFVTPWCLALSDSEKAEALESSEPPLHPHSPLFRRITVTILSTFHININFFRVQSCPNRSLHNVFNAFPLLDASLELNFRDPVQHRLPFNFFNLMAGILITLACK